MSLLSGLARRAFGLPHARGPVERFVEWVAMRDGTRLTTAVFRPRCPIRGVVVTRTDTAIHSTGRPARFLAHWLAEQGYLVVMQECRGLQRSEGHFTPFRNEADDGQALIDWVTQQPGGDTPLTLLGIGYGAYCAWAALGATDRPVSGLVAALGARDPYRWFHANRALRLATTFEFAFGLDARTEDAPPRIDLERALAHRPLRDADRVGAREIPWLREWLDHPERDAFWDACCAPMPASAPRSLFLGGWRNAALESQLADYAELHARTNASVPQLVVGPWPNTSIVRQERRTSARLTRTLLHTLIDFLDTDSGNTRQAEPVRAFANGVDRWQTAAAWPPNAPLVAFSLAGDGTSENGTLRDPDVKPTDVRPDVARDAFIYDPADAPTGHAFEANAASDRRDVLRYTSAPLAEDLEIAGVPTLECIAESDAALTDFVARLFTIDSKRNARFLSDGIIRNAASDGAIAIPMAPIWHRVAAGERIHLEISSACFPRFDRHANTRVPPCEASHSDGIPALQRITHSGESESRLLLPTAGSH